MQHRTPVSAEFFHFCPFARRHHTLQLLSRAPRLALPAKFVKLLPDFLFAAETGNFRCGARLFPFARVASRQSEQKSSLNSRLRKRLLSTNIDLVRYEMSMNKYKLHELHKLQCNTINSAQMLQQIVLPVLYVVTYCLPSNFSTVKRSNGFQESEITIILFCDFS